MLGRFESKVLLAGLRIHGLTSAHKQPCGRAFFWL